MVDFVNPLLTQICDNTRMRKTNSKPKKTRAPDPVRWVLWRAIGKWTATLGVWAFIAVGLLCAWYATDLPDIDKALSVTRRPTITLLASDGSEIMRIGDVYGVPVQVDELPPILVQAVLATEDRRFHSHFGVDLIGLARAMVSNVRAGRIVQGGSTITQQAAKNLFLTPERTLKRKIQEVLLSLWLENKFTKEQILTIYLNRVYLGAGTYGIDAASRRYFKRPARKLTPYQSAMIAGLLKAPSRYNPRNSPKLAAQRTRQVIANMVAAGYLTPTDAKAIKAGKKNDYTKSTGSSARYYSDWVLPQVSGFVSHGDYDLVVHTTLNPRLQKAAQKRTSDMLVKSGKKYAVSQAAVVTLSPDGAVRAMIGGRKYASSQYNRVTQARRQAGSIFKPIVYLAGLEAGLSPDSQINAAPVTVDGWTPRNFTPGKLGRMSMADAIARSINTAAVRVSEQAGRKNVINVARRLGLAGKLENTPSIALGVSDVSLLEMTSAYAVFANDGQGVWPYGINKITDNQGRVLYQRQGSGPGPVVSSQRVAQINNMLAGVVRYGTGKNAKLNRPTAGKTGTSQKYRDGWFIGYTANLVSGVWMGNDNSAPTKKMTGGGLPAILWRQVMTDAHKGLKARNLAGVRYSPTQAKKAKSALTRQQKRRALPPPQKKIEQKGFWQDILSIITGDKK